jgi:hypothetical protein
MREIGVHLVITTHTPRHLAAVLASLVWQEEMPASVVVTCDGENSEIAEIIDTWVPMVIAGIDGKPPAFFHISRSHQGIARPNQVRNNGVRALKLSNLLNERDMLVFLDGDMLLAANAVKEYRALASGESGFDFLIPYRINLDQPRSDLLTPDSILTKGPIDELAFPDAALESRHKRYLRQLWLRRRFPFLTKPHKPKIITAHVGVRVETFEAVNGLDEQYTEYGFEDDDLARRLHALRPAPRTGIVVRDILAAHLWHPSRAPSRPTDAPGYARFCRSWTVRAERGLVNPMPQETPTVGIIADRTATSRQRFNSTIAAD